MKCTYCKITFYVWSRNTSNCTETLPSRKQSTGTIPLEEIKFSKTFSRDFLAKLLFSQCSFAEGKDHLFSKVSPQPGITSSLLEETPDYQYLFKVNDKKNETTVINIGLKSSLLILNRYLTNCSPSV